MENRLPKYYVIKKVFDPRWYKYVDHLNKISGLGWGGTFDNYYGVHLSADFHGVKASKYIEDFNGDPVILTLDQFFKHVAEPIEIFDKNNWNIEVKNRTEFNEVCDFLVLLENENNRSTGGNSYNNNNKESYKFIGWNGESFSYDDVRTTSTPKEKSITWGQFMKLKNEYKAPVVEYQTISKANLKELYDNVPEDWQKHIIRKMDEDKFASEVRFTDIEIMGLHIIANDLQKSILSKCFIISLKGQNAFLEGFDVRLVSSISEKIFGDARVFQMLYNSCPSDKPELKNKAFLVDNNFTVATGETFNGGTWITINNK